MMKPFAKAPTLADAPQLIASLRTKKHDDALKAEALRRLCALCDVTNKATRVPLVHEHHILESLAEVLWDSQVQTRKLALLTINNLSVPTENKLVMSQSRCLLQGLCSVMSVKEEDAFLAAIILYNLSHLEAARSILLGSSSLVRLRLEQAVLEKKDPITRRWACAVVSHLVQEDPDAFAQTQVLPEMLAILEEEPSLNWKPGETEDICLDVLHYFARDSNAKEALKEAGADDVLVRIIKQDGSYTDKALYIRSILHDRDGAMVVTTPMATPDGEPLPVVTANQLAVPAWKDSYYDDEPNIVAVFDIDSNGVRLYQHQSYGVKLAVSKSCGLFALFYLVNAGAIGIVLPFALYWFSMIMVILHSAQQSANQSQVHIAVTDTCIRYDQENPLVVSRMPLNKILSCKVTQRALREWHMCGRVHFVNIVELELASGKQTIIGLREATAFRDLLLAQQMNAGMIAMSKSENDVAPVDEEMESLTRTVIREPDSAIL